MTNTSQSSNKRIRVFDGYKGVALLSIIAYYFFQHILPGGYLAVNSFLLMAGFFNFRHFYIYDLKGQKVKTFHYYKRRFKRLFFPMLAIILMTGTFILLFARNFMFNLRNMAVSSLFFVNNFYQIFNDQSYFVQAANPSPFNHLWYVSLLAQLIILTPIMMKLFYSWHRKPTITVNMLLILSGLSAFLMAYLYKEGEDPSSLYYSLFTRAFAYTFGGAIGLLFPPSLKARPMDRKVSWVLNITGLISAILLFFMLKFMYGTQAFAYRFGMTLFTLLNALLLIVCIHPSSLWHRVFSSRLLSFFGQRSYSYYIWFYPVYLISPQFVQKIGLGYWLTNLLVFIIIMILSECTYQIFEKEIISLPIGQDFNFNKMKYQFDFLKNHQGKLIGIKIITIIYIFNLILGSIGILASPETRDNISDDLQEVIEQNKELAENTLTNNTENEKIVNYVEGLSQQESLYANGVEITFIGDSVLLSAVDDIQFVFPKAVISGETGRQLFNSATLPLSLDGDGKLKEIVVTLLGSNGTFTPSQIDDYILNIGSEKDIFFVNSTAERNWIPDMNYQLAQASQRHGNVYLIDWSTYSEENPEWLRDDYGHPSQEGSLELAKFIAKEIYRQR